MRIAALIFGLIGVAGAAFTGMVRLNQIEKEVKPAMELARVFGDQDNPKLAEMETLYKKLVLSSYVLLGSAVLGVVACAVVLRRMGVVAGVMFLVAYLAPLAILQEKATALVPGGLALAALFSFFVKPRLLAPAYSLDAD